MLVTYKRLSQALEGAIAYYTNPSIPRRLIEREIELCKRIKGELGDNVKAFYGTGYPFWAYYTIGKENTTLTAELVRFVSSFKRVVDSNGEGAHHCLSTLDETRLRTPFRDGIDLKGNGNCIQCKPTIRQIFYVMPDADVYIIVDRYPTKDEVQKIELAGAELGFFPPYKNLEGIINSFLALSKLPTMHFDYVLVKSDDFLGSLRSSINWQELRVPCMVLRYGTESFRENWLDIGVDAVFSLQPFVQYDPLLRAAFNKHLMELFSRLSADEVIEQGRESETLPEQFKRFLQTRCFVDSFMMRYSLGRERRIDELIKGDSN